MDLPLPPILLELPPKEDQLRGQMQDILASALKTSPLSAEAAEVAAEQLRRLCPPEKKKIEGFLWALWGFFLDVVQQTPAVDPRMEFLVDVVRKLKALDSGTVEIWNDTVKLWEDLPILGPSIRDHWNLNPIITENEDLRLWVSLNGFAARIHGQSLYSCTNFAIWEFRTALEEELPRILAPSWLDCIMTTTSWWILAAGAKLFREALNPPELGQTERRMFKTGKLCDAEPGLNLERWTFWRERLEYLLPEVREGPVKTDVEDAIHTMKMLEDAVKGN